MKRFLRTLPFAGIGIILAILPLGPLSAVTYMVNSASDIGDHNPGDGTCSIQHPDVDPRWCTLRAAVQEANSNPGADIVSLTGAPYLLSISGINDDNCVTGDLDVTDHLTIQGVSADETIIDGAGLDRAIHVHNGVTLTLDKLTVTGGSALDNSAYPAGLGGGVLVANDAFLRLHYSRVEGNRALAGGGIGGWYSGEIEVLYSEIRDNEIQEAAGYMSLGGALHLEPQGGGLHTHYVEVSHSTISGNGCQAGTASTCAGGMVLLYCGDVPNTGLRMSNSTLSGNEGTGITLNRCSADIDNSTVYGNTGYGISIYSNALFPPRARNTIFAHNGIQDCNIVPGLDFNLNYNLSSDDSCDLNPTVIDHVNTDPELYALGTYDPVAPSITRTHAPRWGSPVIDEGGNLINNPNLPADDQEEYPRPMDGNQNAIASYDKGAIEVVPCVVDIDRFVRHETVSDGVRQACNQLHVGPNVVIDGTFVHFMARHAVSFTTGISVNTGTVFSVNLVRWAGQPL